MISHQFSALAHLCKVLVLSEDMETSTWLLFDLDFIGEEGTRT